MANIHTLDLAVKNLLFTDPPRAFRFRTHQDHQVFTGNSAENAVINYTFVIKDAFFRPGIGHYTDRLSLINGHNI